MITRKNIEESHKRQLEGEDCQAVANDIAMRLGLDPDEHEEEWKQLMDGPHDGCNCRSCKNAAWE